jgi:tetratricopeptide (TPR) repeat protein
MPKTNRALALLKAVRASMRKERWREATELLKKSSVLVEKHWELLWNLGWCHFKLERFDEAEKYPKKAAEVAPQNRNHTCVFGLGVVYLRKKQYKKAVRALSEVLQIKESYPARLSLALAYLEQGKIQEAENTHLESIRLKPKSCERYEAYADFLSDVGRGTEADKMNRKAQELKRVN